MSGPSRIYFIFDDFTPSIICILLRRKVNESCIIKVYELYYFIDLNLSMAAII